MLLQGQANHHGWWSPLRAAFSAQFCTLTVDYRGTGLSTMATRDDARRTQWSTPAFADDIAAVLAAAGLGAAHVYGTSMGGRIAQHLAATRPDLVRGLVLAATTPGHVIGVERDERVRRLLAYGIDGDRRRAMIDLFYRPTWVAEHGGYAGVPADLLGDPSMSVEARSGHLRTSNTHDASGVLQHITAPTLIVHGSADEMAPVANAHLLAERIPNARVEIFDGGRHGFFHEMQDVVTPLVLQHFAALD